MYCLGSVSFWVEQNEKQNEKQNEYLLDCLVEELFGYHDENLFREVRSDE